MLLDPPLKLLANLQEKRALSVATIAFLLTAFFALGITQIYLETDFMKELPQDNPAFVLNNRVRDTFSGQDTIFVLVEVDPTSQSTRAVKDIRDPRVVRMLLDMEDEFKEKSGVDKIQSVGSLFSKGPTPDTLEGVKSRIEMIPGANGLYNRDYTATIVSVFANVGSGPEKVNSLTNDIAEGISEVPKPPGIKTSITGMPPIRVRIGEILVNDAKYTTTIASAIILLLLLAMTRPVTRGLIVFTPLMMALIWTLGTMGWLGIPLSMVTVGVGAMILGLGVEYSAFYVSVYQNNRDHGRTQYESLYTSLKEVGTAIFGSASTTVAGFLALLAASMPLLHHLGIALALGITYCFVTALVFNPALLVLEENHWKRILGLVCKMSGHGEVPLK